MFYKLYKCAYKAPKTNDINTKQYKNCANFEINKK